MVPRVTVSEVASGLKRREASKSISTYPPPSAHIMFSGFMSLCIMGGRLLCSRERAEHISMASRLSSSSPSLPLSSALRSVTPSIYPSVTTAPSSSSLTDITLGSLGLFRPMRAEYRGTAELLILRWVAHTLPSAPYTNVIGLFAAKSSLSVTGYPPLYRKADHCTGSALCLFRGRR